MLFSKSQCVSCYHQWRVVSLASSRGSRVATRKIKSVTTTVKEIFSITFLFIFLFFCKHQYILVYVSPFFVVLNKCPPTALQEQTWTSFSSFHHVHKLLEKRWHQLTSVDFLLKWILSRWSHRTSISIIFKAEDNNIEQILKSTIFIYLGNILALNPFR